MLQSKHFILYLVTAVVLSAVVFSSFGYYLGANRATPVTSKATATSTTSNTSVVSTATPIAAVSDTASTWQTYASLEHGYSLNYPKAWLMANNGAIGKKFYAPEFGQTDSYVVSVYAIAADGSGMESYEKVSTQKKVIGGKEWDVSSWKGLNNAEVFGADNHLTRAKIASYYDGKLAYHIDMYYKVDQASLFESTFEEMANSFNFTK